MNKVTLKIAISVAFIIGILIEAITIFSIHAKPASTTTPLHTTLSSSGINTNGFDMIYPGFNHTIKKDFFLLATLVNVIEVQNTIYADVGFTINNTPMQQRIVLSTESNKKTSGIGITRQNVKIFLPYSNKNVKFKFIPYSQIISVLIPHLHTNIVLDFPYTTAKQMNTVQLATASCNKLFADYMQQQTSIVTCYPHPITMYIYEKF